MMIDEIEQKIINILPTSNTMFDEIDYSILEKRKEDWIKLSEITHSIVLVFDCYTNLSSTYKCNFLGADNKQ